MAAFTIIFHQWVIVGMYPAEDSHATSPSGPIWIRWTWLCVLTGVSLVSTFMLTPGNAWYRAGGAIGATVAVLGVGWLTASGLRWLYVGGLSWWRDVEVRPFGTTAFMIVFTITSSLGMTRYAYLSSQAWPRQAPATIAAPTAQPTIPVARIQVFDAALAIPKLTGRVRNQSGQSLARITLRLSLLSGKEKVDGTDVTVEFRPPVPPAEARSFEQEVPGLRGPATAWTFTVVTAQSVD